MKLARALVRVRSALHELAKRHLRSPHWRAVEKAHLAREPACVACGGVERLQVHHVIAFEADPSLELEPSNLLTLCEGPRLCHLLIGHGGSFRFYVPDVRRLARMARFGNLMRQLAVQRAREWRRPMHEAPTAKAAVG